MYVNHTRFIAKIFIFATKIFIHLQSYKDIIYLPNISLIINID